MNVESHRKISSSPPTATSSPYHTSSTGDLGFVTYQDIEGEIVRKNLIDEFNARKHKQNVEIDK